MAEQGEAWASELKVEIGGDVESAQILGVAVDLDLNQPDMAMISLRNEQHRYSNSINPGDAVKVTLGDTDVFQGEVVGLEPSYRTQGGTKCVVRAFNKLHRLLRSRKSRTFADMSDQDIAGVIADDHGLVACCDSQPSVTHAHVYQHNQTDLEFLRLRAARLGFEVWVEGTDLYFESPTPDADSGIELVMGSDGADASKIPLTSFNPRLSTARVVGKVTVRGWDPERKEEIVGEATASSSSLGDSLGTAATSSGFGSTESFEVDHPIFSVDEARAIAEARLGERMMSYITGDAVCRGTPDIKPGIVVTMEINVDDASDRFNGKYMVVGTSHHYAASTGSGENASGGYTTIFRFARDASNPGAQGGDQASELE